MRWLSHLVPQLLQLSRLGRGPVEIELLFQLLLELLDVGGLVLELPFELDVLFVVLDEGLVGRPVQYLGQLLVGIHGFVLVRGLIVGLDGFGRGGVSSLVVDEVFGLDEGLFFGLFSWPYHSNRIYLDPKSVIL